MGKWALFKELLFWTAWSKMYMTRSSFWLVYYTSQTLFVQIHYYNYYDFLKTFTTEVLGKMFLQNFLRMYNGTHR